MEPSPLPRLGIYRFVKLNVNCNLHPFEEEPFRLPVRLFPVTKNEPLISGSEPVLSLTVKLKELPLIAPFMTSSEIVLLLSGLVNLMLPLMLCPD
jgi:hypothetical protein